MTIERPLGFIAALLLLAASTSAAALPRDEVQKQAFRRDHPCPSTGKTKGACPGYEVDHRKALMNGGADRPSNMQWLSHTDHKGKTKADLSTCRQSYLCKNGKLKRPLPWQPKSKLRNRPQQ